MRTYILASRSPRRKELLEEMGLSFTVVSMEIEEHLRTDIELTKAVEQLAYEKAEAVARCHPDSIVIGADTVVALGAQVFGKPKDEAQAREMLRALSGKRHQVIGGVAVLSAQQQVTFSCVTNVQFYPISETEITDYIRSGEPMDKAGAYGIQGLGKRFVEGIEGDYFNVVGLPVSRLLRVLAGFETENC